MWYYKNKEFTTEDIGDHMGFVYLVTDLSNSKKYIGKKKFWSITMRPPLKGKKRRRRTVKESDWKSYYGSSAEVKEMVAKLGPDNFKREILHLCTSTGAMSYLELKEQIDRDVLFRSDYYNEFVGVKIHSMHVQSLKEQFGDNS